MSPPSAEKRWSTGDRQGEVEKTFFRARRGVYLFISPQKSFQKTVEHGNMFFVSTPPGPPGGLKKG